MTTTGPVHHLVEVSADRVKAWATKPLSFGPKDWRRDLRLDLIAGLASITTGGQALIAQFFDRDSRVLDRERRQPVSQY